MYEFLPKEPQLQKCKYDGCDELAPPSCHACIKHQVAYDAIRRQEESKRTARRKKRLSDVRAQFRAQMAAQYAGSQ
jgi:hypothetical protein